ncbi:DUF2625 domain-containing protein [Actinoplanes cyaneus]|uniref:DUF2625 domain-containing protein n=1 Tax=Actinoplanes cyaneus TaxID=52696 RepID=UPI0022268CFF|nr:DUF2625 domain-containing protein [Actinoplanes cyaneus]
MHDSAWPEIEAAVAGAPYPALVLAADPQRADEELLRAQVTTRSWLGAVVHRSGGLVLDHGWLRILGSGNDEHHLASLGEVNDNVAGGVIVAQASWVGSSPGCRTPPVSRPSGISPRTPWAGRTASKATATGSLP